MNMQSLKSFVTSKQFLIGMALGILAGVAYLGRNALVKKAASVLPGSQA